MSRRLALLRRLCSNATVMPRLLVLIVTSLLVASGPAIGTPDGDGTSDPDSADTTTDVHAPPDRPARRAVSGLDRCAKGPAPGCTCMHRPPHPSTLADAPSCFPTFRSNATALSAGQRRRMTGVSWHEGCPVPLDRLRSVTLLHWDFDGRVYEGELVVADSAVDAVTRAFRRLYESRFPVERMEPVDAFGGSDARSMAANNTSAFNCRRISGTKTVSRHAFGDAIDLNPVQNPWVTGDGSTAGSVQPPAGAAWLDRANVRPGMVVEGGPAVAAFESVGWKWGGRWKRARDYQHFSATGK